MGILISGSLASPHSSPDVAQIQRIADRLAFHNDGGHFEDYRPGWDADRYEPCKYAAAQNAGYTRGYDLDHAAEPIATLAGLARAFWLVGHAQGVAARRRDDAERAAFEADLAESAFRYQDPHPIEVIAANGVLAYREGGSL